MTRPLVVGEAPHETLTVEAPEILTVEACGRACATAAADASGKIHFSDGWSDGPMDAAIDRASQTIRGSFMLTEREREREQRTSSSFA